MYTYILHIYVQLFIVHILLLWQVQSQHMDRVYWMIWSISDVQLLLMMMTGMKMSMLIIDDASHTFICFSRRHPKRDDFVLNYWSQTVIDEMKWKVLDVQDCNFLFNFGGIYVYVQSNHLCWFGVDISCCISLCITVDYNNINCPIMLGFSWLVNCICVGLCWIICWLKSDYVNHDHMLTFPTNNKNKIVFWLLS